jgi:hypothetical protein
VLSAIIEVFLKSLINDHKSTLSRSTEREFESARFCGTWRVSAQDYLDSELQLHAVSLMNLSTSLTVAAGHSRRSSLLVSDAGAYSPLPRREGERERERERRKRENGKRGRGREERGGAEEKGKEGK